MIAERASSSLSGREQEVHVVADVAVAEKGDALSVDEERRQADERSAVSHREEPRVALRGRTRRARPAASADAGRRVAPCGGDRSASHSSRTSSRLSKAVA